jgi:hypothetical protein
VGLADYAFQRSFSGGELDPSLHARADIPRYTQGCRALTNFFVRKAGGISNRCGTQYVATAGVPGSLVKIYPWTFTAADQAILIEAGDEYFRFHQNGAPLVIDEDSVPAWSGSDAYTQGDLVIISGQVYYATADNEGEDPTDASSSDWYTMPADGTYQIPTPYPSGSFNSPAPLRFSQSGAIITITHPGFAPMELQNTNTLASAPRWVLVEIETDPSIDAPPTDSFLEGQPSQPPTGSDASHDPVPGDRTFRYKVTAVDQVTYEESLPSAEILVANTQVPTEAHPVVLTWTAVVGAVEYNVYLDPFGNNTYGYIGKATEQETFNDVGFAPDFTRTPPVQRDPFSGEYDKPEMSVIYQQRRVFAYTDNNPAGVEMSRTGFRSNFTMSSPLQDDDAISFTLASNDNNVVRDLVPLDNLVLLTESGPVVLFGDGQDGVIRPDAINARNQGEGGAARTPATTVGNSAVYVHRGGHMVLVFDLGGDKGTSVTDLTVMAQHLFESRKVTKVVYAKDPHSIVWALGDDGVLLGLTFVPTENVWAWHKHTTGAADVIEDICVLPEDEGDVLYLVVQRTIDGNDTRYIERLALREGITADNLAARCIFADSCVTYNDDPATTITGLDHLEGEVVSVVADGVVVSNGDPDLATHTVSGGAITIADAASIVHVGLPIRFPQFESLSLDVEGSNVRAKKKRVQGVTAIVDRSVQGFWAGKTVATLTQQQRKTWEVAGELVSQGLEMSILASWDDEGRFIIRHTEPTPLTILALLPFIEIGG